MAHDTTKADIEGRIDRINRKSDTPVEYQSNIGGWRLVDADTFTPISPMCQSKREFDLFLRGYEAGVRS